MKTITFILILLLFSNFNTTTSSSNTGSKIIYSISESDRKYKELYDLTIQVIKKSEGFRANWYDDYGYQAIGYGQRGVFYHKRIVAPISELQAHDILVESFNKHMKATRKYYPRLNKFQRLAVTHLSYQFGLGRVLKYKLIDSNGNINEKKLLSMAYRDLRVFNLNVYRYKI